MWSGVLGSKKIPIVWESVRKPVYAGGPCIRNIVCWNKATLLAKLWCIEKDKSRVWLLWIHEYYVKGQQVASVEG